MKKFIVSVVFSLSLLVAATSAFAAAGSLDSTFGNGGIVETNFGPNGNNFTFSDAALAPDGDIVVAGSVAFLDGQQSTAVIVRYLPNGVLDPSFGSDGILTLPAPASFFLGISFIETIALQPNGQILALFGAASSSDSEIALLRFNSDGAPDALFGSDGQVVVNFPAPSGFAASPSLVLAEPDGKILLAGAATPPFRSKLSPQTVLARYLSNGALDATFGSGGFASAVAISTPSALALLSGDGILVLNTAGQLAQFSSAGALVKTPTGGTVIATKQTAALTFQSNGNFLIAGAVQGPDGRKNADSIIDRFLVNGTADSSFSSPAIAFGPNGAGVDSYSFGIALDSQGRVIIGGIFETPGNGIWGLARVQANGSLDTTFGHGGSLTTQVGLEGFVDSVLVQSNNEIVAVGEVQVSKDTADTMEDLAVARYLAQ